MSKWLWIVGAGPIQRLAISKAVGLGLNVIASDGAPTAVGLQVPGVMPLVISTYDVDAHLDMARMLKDAGYQVDGVMTFGADVGPTVSALATFWGTPAVSEYIARMVRDKGVVRSTAFSTLNLRHPHYWLVGRKDDWQQARRFWEASGGSYPCVVKPVDNCGGRGVSRIERALDWTTQLVNAFRYVRDGDEVLVEELLEGQEFGLDFLITDGDLHLINSYSRDFACFDCEQAVVVPFEPPQAALEIAHRMAVALGVDQGPFKIDFIEDKRYGLCVGECATRQSGGWDEYTLTMATGFDPVLPNIQYALGETLADLNGPRLGYYACHYAPTFAPGMYQGWEGLDEARRMPGVLDVFVHREQGEISKSGNSAERPLFVAALGRTAAEAKFRASAAGHVIRPHYVNCM